jgi:hypothetical protein
MSTPDQVDEPCYSWNNKDVNGKALSLRACQPSIKKGAIFLTKDQSRRIRHLPTHTL